MIGSQALAIYIKHIFIVYREKLTGKDSPKNNYNENKKMYFKHLHLSFTKRKFHVDTNEYTKYCNDKQLYSKDISISDR